MSEHMKLYFSSREFCQSAHISTALLVEFVTTGILEPAGEAPQDWRFDEYMLATARRALKLQRELDIEWAAVAVVLDLLDQVDVLRSENRQLAHRLARFLQD